MTGEPRQPSHPLSEFARELGELIEMTAAGEGGEEFRTLAVGSARRIIALTQASLVHLDAVLEALQDDAAGDAGQQADTGVDQGEVASYEIDVE